MSIRDYRNKAWFVPLLGVLLLAPSTAGAVFEGTPANTCAFPSAVRLDSTRTNAYCTGVYIGGRVIITAAHCFDNRGYQLDRDVIAARTGAEPDLCTADSDCPSVMIAGEPRELVCKVESFDGTPGQQGDCYLPDLEYSNEHLDAYFGESYDPYGDAHPGNIVPIRYCHINPGYLQDPVNEGQDFAYCLLAEEPDIQPVPIMMPCEVDLFMQGDYDLDVLIAGFGVASFEEETAPGKPGRKRWATATTDNFAFTSGDFELSLTHFSDFMPGGGVSGDSGGPVYVRLPPPHNTWRVFGTFVKPFLAAAPWQFIDWMLLDPEVDSTKIRPCSDLGGDWKPGPACQGFPLELSEGAGGWSYGPKACYNKNVGGQEDTCGPGFGSPILAPGSPSPPSDSPATAASCSVTGEPAPVSLLMPLLGLFLVRKRRRHLGVGCVVLVVGVGCGGDQVNDGGNGETGAESGGVEPPGLIQFNPNFHNVHSGISLPGAGFDQLAVGNIARPVGDVDDEGQWWQRLTWVGSAPPDSELGFAR